MKHVNHVWTILDRIKEERFRQERLRESCKFPFTCAEVGPSDCAKLAILMEEVGEATRAILETTVYHQETPIKGLRQAQKELIQVAAVACAHAEALQEQLNILEPGTFLFRDNPQTGEY